MKVGCPARVELILNILELEVGAEVRKSCGKMRRLQRAENFGLRDMKDSTLLFLFGQLQRIH